MSSSPFSNIEYVLSMFKFLFLSFSASRSYKKVLIKKVYLENFFVLISKRQQQSRFLNDLTSAVSV